MQNLNITRIHPIVAAGALIVSSWLLGAQECRAEEAKDAAIVKPLRSDALTGIPGKEVLMLTVEYLPGGASAAHRHDADVFVYVLEGSIITQVDGKPAVTVKAGETFRETPTDIHRQSANASKTQPAKFLVFMVKDKDKPATRPVTSAP